jgi:hypothetical protein
MFLDRFPAGTTMQRDAFREGLFSLDDCSLFLARSANPATLLGTIKDMRPFFKLALCQAIGALLGNPDWPTTAQDPDLEFPPVVWALMLGPLGIAAGFIEGRLIAPILLEAEEKWIAANIDKADYTDQKVEIQALATNFCAWGKSILKPTRCVPRNGKIAKRSTLKVIGYHNY